jgi:hypothetical protein
VSLVTALVRLPGPSLAPVLSKLRNAGLVIFHEFLPLPYGRGNQFLPALQKACSQNANIMALNRFVGWDGDNSLDLILSATPIPRNIDFLSIDIEGNDYHVWRAMSMYRPKAICIEFNQVIPGAFDEVAAALVGLFLSRDH